MTGKRRAKPASPITQDMVADLCHAIYLRKLGAYDAAQMVQKDEEKSPGCGDSKLRARAMAYQVTVRAVLEELAQRGALILQPGDSAVEDECPPLDDEIPEVEE